MTEMTFQSVWYVSDISLGTSSVPVEFPEIITAPVWMWLAKSQPNLLFLRPPSIGLNACVFTVFEQFTQFLTANKTFSV